MRKVITIIVSYNFEPWIHKCIQSIKNSTYPSEIIVIDNNSQDNTVSIIKTYYPEVILIESNSNLGFGKANNIGIEYAIKKDYEYVFLVNQDAWIDSHCVATLLSYNSSKALLSPIHYDGTGIKLDKGFSSYYQEITSSDDTNYVSFVNAAFWLIPLSIIREIGAFSPIFYHYGEDKDFANRLKYHNFKIIIVKEAKAFHDRQDRKASSGINFKGEYVYHLTEFCNINYSLPIAFSNSILAIIKKAGQQLLKANLSSCRNYILIIFKLLYKLPNVISTRADNKKVKSK